MWWTISSRMQIWTLVQCIQVAWVATGISWITREEKKPEIEFRRRAITWLLSILGCK
jgi:hypothetical protein